MKLQDIDYSAIEPVDLWDKAIREKFHVSSKLFVGICIVLSLVGFVVTRQPILIIFPASLIITVITTAVYQYKNDQWRAFAQTNGWGITPGQLATIGFVPPSLMDSGHGRKLSDVVHADIDGHMCSIYAYQFTVGQGRGSRTYYCTITRVVLPKAFPHLLLDSKGSHRLKSHRSAHVPVKLEGDFNKYFQLYHAKGEHVDALSIITPDVMQTLIDSNEAQDIEIVDQNVYFITYSEHRSATLLPKLLASVDALSDELVHKSKTLRYNGGAPNSVHLTQTAAQYFRSGERVINALWTVIFLIVMAPFLAFILIGIVTSLEGR